MLIPHTEGDFLTVNVRVDFRADVMRAHILTQGGIVFRQSFARIAIRN